MPSEPIGRSVWAESFDAIPPELQQKLRKAAEKTLATSDLVIVIGRNESKDGDGHDAALHIITNAKFKFNPVDPRQTIIDVLQATAWVLMKHASNPATGGTPDIPNR